MHAPAAPPTHLTDSQRQTLTLAAGGLTTSEIAGRLDWSVERVRSTLASAILDLGATSKLEAVLVAIRTGLIERPGEA